MTTGAVDELKAARAVRALEALCARAGTVDDALARAAVAVALLDGAPPACAICGGGCTAPRVACAECTAAVAGALSTWHRVALAATQHLRSVRSFTTHGAYVVAVACHLHGLPMPLDDWLAP